MCVTVLFSPLKIGNNLILENSKTKKLKTEKQTNMELVAMEKTQVRLESLRVILQVSIFHNYELLHVFLST